MNFWQVKPRDKQDLFEKKKKTLKKTSEKDQDHINLKALIK